MQSRDHNDSDRHAADERPSLWHRWHQWPLYLRIIGAVALGILAGVILGERAAVLQVPSKLVLRVLGALRRRWSCWPSCRP